MAGTQQLDSPWICFMISFRLSLPSAHPLCISTGMPFQPNPDQHLSATNTALLFNHPKTGVTCKISPNELFDTFTNGRLQESLNTRGC